MFVVQIFLPLADNDGRPFSASLYQAQKSKLADMYGGLTAFTRAPAEGVWGEGEVKDDIIIFEVMTVSLDRAWWQAYRQALQTLFKQDQILIRATAAERL